MHGWIEPRRATVSSGLRLGAKSIEPFADPTLKSGDAGDSKTMRRLGGNPRATFRIALKNAVSSPAKSDVLLAQGNAVEQSPLHSFWAVLADQESPAAIRKDPAFGGILR